MLNLLANLAALLWNLVDLPPSVSYRLAELLVRLGQAYDLAIIVPLG